MFDLLRRLWKELRKRRSVGRVIIVESMNDIPLEIRADIYLVQRGGVDKRAVMTCPCRCGRRIDVSLVGRDEPHWTAQMGGGKISLLPSVWLRQDPCQSHFFVRDGKFIWV
jgi:hypothetical protein